MSTTQRLAQKTAVITGGSTGIGLATARAFIQEGARVIITGKSEENLAAAVRELGPQAIPVRADVRKLEDLDALAQRARELFEHVDVLFANAGRGWSATLEQVTEAFYDELFDTNVKGVFFTVQKLAGLLRQGSSVILCSSTVSEKGAPASSTYFATKAAVRSLARTLAVELAPRGIRVNAISPGMVPTEFQGKMGVPPEVIDGFYKLVTQVTPLGRLGRPDEIAKAVLFLASDESSYMTAGDLLVDGGYRDV
ncbi:glucose 1-dehydrogenase [Hyalangium rubrum]|uniref:Glucose 1-dehydrogenase n=1 Tax=Hyalangium rubrum TaxID=3103134 RepID=A0ABU5HFN2_9BACT|nr:glucose 1-dehydrogenase [Hyalangium sp. s54d21]MDY7231674.1 glucose 1-dehydrogenase [Hyalangium sp. s54d21]